MSHASVEGELIVILRPEAELDQERARPKAARRSSETEIRRVVEANRGTLRRLFGGAHARAIYESTPSPSRHHFDDFYGVRGHKPDLEVAARALRELPSVAAAYLRPTAVLAVRTDEPTAAGVPAPLTPGDFRALQKHLGAPPGIDATSAWSTPGALGDDVTIIDIEWAWRFDHEDFARDHLGVLAGSGQGDPHQVEHGTAVLGVLGARHGAVGVDGIVPHARLGAIALARPIDDPGALALPLAEAIHLATSRLGRGDILLLEVHVPGPRYGFRTDLSERGYIAPEWWPDVLAAIRDAVRKGVVVVEAAGNGAEDLDDPLYDQPAEGFPSDWVNPFRHATAQGATAAARPLNSSGAILVAAGSPDDRVRMGFSNFGSRIDAHGWGASVVTTGYGNLLDGGPTRRYTYTFGGTSSAAAMVAGALASVQGALKKRGKIPLDAEGAARLLHALPAPSAPGARIGNLPNVPAMIELALP